MKIFEPERFYKRVYRIPFHVLKKEGVKGLIFDIDNTLVPPDADADRKIVSLIRSLKEEGFRVCLVSNNGEKRVAPFAKALDLPYVCDALKPRKYGYLKALEIMKTEPEETVSVGDQLFTDVWGANRAGIKTILVSPMEEREEIQIRFKRILERPFLWSYFRRKKKAACGVRNGTEST